VRRPRLDREQVVLAAESIVDALGWDGLTMAALAAQLGAKSPSLYNHVASLDALRADLQQRTMRRLGQELVTAAMGRAGRDGFLELARAYRAFVHRHPHRYEGATRAPIDRDAFADAAQPASEALLAVVRSYGVTPDDALLAQLAVFSSLHGAVALEVGGFYGGAVDHDSLYDLVVAAAERQLAELAAAAR
jgi:AcrR family transcriptional regulator